MKALAIGELCVDWLSLEAGASLMNARTFYRYIGGNASNVAIGLARLGLDAAIISRIGDDKHGEFLLKCLDDEGVDRAGVALDLKNPTAQCYLTESAPGYPDYYNWPSPNASKSLTKSDLKDIYFECSWVMHLAAVSFIAKPRRETMSYAVEQARLHGLIISFDACFPLVESDGGKAAAWKAMKSADIVKFNFAELCYWSGMPAPARVAAETEAEAEAEAKKRIAKLLPELPAALIVVTLAEKGALLYAKNESAYCPPYKVNSIGDVGPGDGFASGLIYGLSTMGEHGMKRSAIYQLDMPAWQELARWGSCAGALVTRARSATEMFPRLDELQAAWSQARTDAAVWENPHP